MLLPAGPTPRILRPEGPSMNACHAERSMHLPPPLSIVCEALTTTFASRRGPETGAARFRAVRAVANANPLPLAPMRALGPQVHSKANRMATHRHRSPPVHLPGSSKRKEGQGAVRAAVNEAYKPAQHVELLSPGLRRNPSMPGHGARAASTQGSPSTTRSGRLADGYGDGPACLTASHEARRGRASHPASFTTPRARLP